MLVLKIDANGRIEGFQLPNIRDAIQGVPRKPTDTRSWPIRPSNEKQAGKRLENFTFFQLESELLHESGPLRGFIFSYGCGRCCKAASASWGVPPMKFHENSQRGGRRSVGACPVEI